MFFGKKKRLKRACASFLVLLTILGTILNSAENVFAAEHSETSFFTITDIHFINYNGGEWNEDNIFYDAGAGMAGRSTLDDFWASYGDATFSSLSMAYCMQYLATGPDKAGTYGSDNVLGELYSGGFYDGIVNMLNNAFPANYDYWASQGITNRAAQAMATQTAVWYLCSYWDISGNSSSFYQEWDAGYYTANWACGLQCLRN